MECLKRIVPALLVLGLASGPVLADGEGKKGAGKLTVVTTPWTKVSVDGQEVGSTPVTGHQVEAGKHQVTLENDGLDLSLTLTVKVVSGKETRISHVFEVESTKGDGTLTVSTSPWAEVYVDGEFLGSTPILRHSLDPGKHTVKLVNEGLGISEVLTVTIEHGMDTTITKSLSAKPKTGTLSVNASPWARVYVNGVDLGNTPIVGHVLEPGKHKVKLVNEDLGVSETVTVKVKKGEETKVWKDLSGKTGAKPKGTLSVTTTPWSVVHVDGKKVGNTPLIKLKLEPGIHEVKLVSEDLGATKVVKVKIVAGEDTSLVESFSAKD